MSSNVPYRLATTLIRAQSSSPLAGATRYSPFLNIAKSNTQGNEVRKTTFRPLASFLPLHTFTPALDVRQNITLRRPWTSISCRNFPSMHSTTTKNQGGVGASLGSEPLKNSSARSASIIYKDMRRQLHTNIWRSKIRGYKSSSTGSQSGSRSLDSAPLGKSNRRAETQRPDSSKATAPFLGNKHIIDRLPNIPHMHRPTKEELLAAATGFWSRLKVRFKWFSIRSARPFNVDEIGAFFSWFLLGHVLWVVLGTTTFFSLAIFAVNTVFAQGMRLSPSICVQLMTVQKHWPGG